MEQPRFSISKAVRPPRVEVISAIVPVWKGSANVTRLLKTIAAQTRPVDEVIIIDNGSAGSVAGLSGEYSVRIVRFATNRGFAAAVNQGVAESKGDLLAVLNDDIELSPDWAEKLASALDRHTAWFATGLICSSREPDRIDGTWDLVSRAGMPWRAGNGAAANHPAFRLGKPIAIAPFTAVLLKRALWDRVGPLDERFESYLEDVDFGLRCAVAACPGWYEPAAICHHQGSASLGRWHPQSVRRMSRNQLFLIWKHFPAKLRLQWFWGLIAGQGLWGLIALRHGTGWEWLSGKREALSRKAEFAEASTAAVKQALELQEREIFQLQAAIGFDTYWTFYKWLTQAGPGAQ